jgi:hypothetical protein
VVLTEPEGLVVVEVVVEATPGRTAPDEVATAEDVEFERPSKRIV